MFRNDGQSIYLPGQVWGYQTRPCDEQSYLIVVRVDDALGPANIVHIYIDGVKMRDPFSGEWKVEAIRHLPIAEESLSASVTELLGVTTQLPDFHKGYEIWRREFDNSRAGYFTAPVAACLERLTQANVEMT